MCIKSNDDVVVRYRFKAFCLFCFDQQVSYFPELFECNGLAADGADASSGQDLALDEDDIFPNIFRQGIIFFREGTFCIPGGLG